MFLVWMKHTVVFCTFCHRSVDANLTSSSTINNKFITRLSRWLLQVKSLKALFRVIHHGALISSKFLLKFGDPIGSLRVLVRIGSHLLMHAPLLQHELIDWLITSEIAKVQIVEVYCLQLLRLRIIIVEIIIIGSQSFLFELNGLVNFRCVSCLSYLGPLQWNVVDYKRFMLLLFKTDRIKIWLTKIEGH